MVSITVKELLQWEKKSKDFNQQTRTMENQISNLNLEIQEKTRIIEKYFIIIKQISEPNCKA